MTLEEQIRQASLGEEGESAKPIIVDLGNGQVATFNTQEELSNSLKEALGHVNGEVTRLRQELEAARATPPTEGRYVTGDEDVNPDKFNMDKFVELFKSNTPEAFNYVDQFREDKYKPTLRELEAMKQEYEAQKFIASHPEFPGGEYADKLEKLRQELNLPFNKVGLEAAYAHGISSNVIPDFKLQFALQQQQQQFLQYLQSQGLPIPGQTPQNNVTQQQPYIQSNQQVGGIPTLPRNGGQQSNTTVDQLENMSLEQIEKILKQNNMI